MLPGRLRHRVGALSGASTALLAGDGPVVDPHHIQPVRGTSPRHLPHMAGAAHRDLGGPKGPCRVARDADLTVC